jgi:hypothetical protein
MRVAEDGEGERLEQPTEGLPEESEDVDIPVRGALAPAEVVTHPLSGV